MARWVEWLLTTQVRRYRRRYGGIGHVWQGRYKALPIAQDGQLLTVLRYVERNAGEPGESGGRLAVVEPA